MRDSLELAPSLAERYRGEMARLLVAHVALSLLVVAAILGWSWQESGTTQARSSAELLSHELGHRLAGLERLEDGPLCQAIIKDMEKRGITLALFSVSGEHGCGADTGLKGEDLKDALLRRQVLVVGGWTLAPIEGDTAAVLALRLRRHLPWELFGLALLVFMGSYWMQVRRSGAWAEVAVTLPLQRIGQVVEALSLRDFSARVGDLGDVPRELGVLAETFDALAAALEGFQERTTQQMEAIEQANRELLRTREELILAEKMASVGRVSAGLAHEVGNPLAAVLGMVRLMEQGGLKPSDNEDLIRRCSVELERIHCIVSDLLDYARPRDSDLEAVVLLDLLKECAESVREALAGDGSGRVTLKIDRESFAGLPPVLAREGRLRQVFYNLMLNAAESILAQPESQGRVEVTGVAEQGWVLIQISDNGPGIPEEHGDRIFEPFFTTRGKGTGLGLAVSLGIVESFDGTLRYRPNPAGGSIFEMRMKAAQDLEDRPNS